MMGKNRRDIFSEMKEGFDANHRKRRVAKQTPFHVRCRPPWNVVEELTVYRAQTREMAQAWIDKEMRSLSPTSKLKYWIIEKP